MARIVLKPTTAQVVYFLAWAAVALAAPIGIYLWVPGADAEGLVVSEVLVVAFFTLPLVLFSLRRSLGRTVLTDTGATTTGAFLVPRSVAWTEVAAIGTMNRSDRTSTTTYIVLNRTRGRRMMLAAPYSNTFAMLQDRDFEPRLSRIRDSWTRATLTASSQQK